MEIERRYFEGAELRAQEDAGSQKIVGYAAIFNVRSHVIWGAFQEVIAPGAFADTLGMDDIRALWQHDTAQVLGRNRANTLALSEDDKGLRVEIAPPATQAGRDAVESISRGDVDGMSFGFTVPPGGDTWFEDVDGMIIRTLLKVKLWEVSPVTFPAYPQTDVGMRDHFGAKPELPAAFSGARRAAGIEAAGAGARAVERLKLNLLLMSGRPAASPGRI